VGNEDRVNMPLFFGLVGLFNVMFLWPGFFILHFTGIETVSCCPSDAPPPNRETDKMLQFQLPPTGKVWLIIFVRDPFSPRLWPNQKKKDSRG
jgi:solute carrier family 35 protein F5